MSYRSPERKKKRVTFKKRHENQNIRAVLKDLFSQIIEKDPKTTKKIELALASLSKYPLKITSGEDCIILQGFDKNLCRYVDEQLFKNTAQNVDKSYLPQYFKSVQDIEMPRSLEQMNLKAATNMTEEQKCFKGHESYKIMCRDDEFCFKIIGVLAVLNQQVVEFPDRPSLNIKELMLKVQVYCDSTITNWSFVKVLEKRRRYIKSEIHNDIKYYSLTDSGRQALHRIGVLPETEKSNNSHYTENHKKDCSELDTNRVPPFYRTYQEATPLFVTNSHTVQINVNQCPLFMDMPPGSYDIVMLVDKNEPEMLSQKCSAIKCETRSLKVGDVIWVARNKINSQELVLPYILERKRMDDFAASIKDGRFHEQKFRLRKCGLRNVIYLVEDYQGNKHCGLPMATLNQAMANTRVQDGFLVHHTNSTKDTKIFLNMMTLRLANELKGVHLRGSNTDSGGRELTTFEYFNTSSSKTKPLIIKDLFIKMLLQLKGLSVEKALAITKAYSSPAALMQAYGGCDSRDGELLLANLKFNSMTPRVSPAISKIIYMLFNPSSVAQPLDGRPLRPLLN